MYDHHELGGMYTPEQPQASQEDTTEPKEPMDPKKRRRKTYLIAIILLIIAVIIINAVQNEVEPSSDLIEVSDAINDVVVTIDDGSGENLELNLTDFVQGYGLDAFDDLDEASLIVNSAQGKPTSGIGSESLLANVVDAEEEDMVYFATKSYDSELNENFIGVYHYNTINNRWQRVYKDTITAEEGLNVSYMRVLARTGDHLVLLKDFQNNSLGSCSNLWLMGDEEPFELLLLDLSDPYAGFSNFPLPETLRQQAQNEVDECLAKN